MTLDREDPPAILDAADAGHAEPADIDPTASFCCGCITHVPVLVDDPAFVKTICLGEAQAPGRLNLRDLAPHWEPYHSVIGGSAGTFALRNSILAFRPEVRQAGLLHRG